MPLSPVSGFDDLYAGARDRLLLQLYAYCGDAVVADDALNEAFISASRHWHRLSTLPNVEAWLRERAVRRIESRPRVLREVSSAGQARAPAPAGKGAVPGQPSAANVQVLSALRALDPVSRRLLIVRRLGEADLASAAREVGLTDAAAEQALARATTTLHAAGIDTAPAGLQSRLAALGADLATLAQPSSRTLRRAGAKRRYAVTAVLGLAVVGVAAAGGVLSAKRPFGTEQGATRHPSTRTTTPATSPAPLPRLGSGDLLTAAQVAAADPEAGWRVVSRPRRPLGSSVYGGCVMAADNPPPETSWIRDFGPSGRVPTRRDRPLRQVLLRAPSAAEAQRSFREVVLGFTGCEGHQLMAYRAVSVLGDRARLVTLRLSRLGGTVRQTVAVVRSGPAVIVLSAASAPGQPAEIDPRRLTTLAGVAVNRVCARVDGRCATPPYSATPMSPPSEGTPGGFLSIVDLPLVPGIAAPWAATNPAEVTGNPSATACDRTDFSAAGASAVSARSYVIPESTRLPPLFGLSETIGVLEDGPAANAFVAGVVKAVRGCHHREPTLSVRRGTSFTTHLASGTVWLVRQRISPKRTAVFRVALIRSGAAVAEVTLTPGGGYDVHRADMVALAKRAGVRLSE